MSIEENIDQSDLDEMGKEKILLGENLMEKLNQFKHIDGVTKIQRKILQDIKFLQKVQSTNQLKINHILCSNLIHYNYLVKILTQTKNVQHLDYPVKVGGNRKSTIRIDIVADNGSTWIKVIARNPKAINDIVIGRASYGTKSIFDHAYNYVQGAAENHCCFKEPKIIFDFASSIDSELTDSLNDIGIAVRVDGESSDNEKFEIEEVNKLNLDVTTLMAYVSAQTNGSYNWEFEEPLLTEQAVKESKHHVKKYLEEIFEGKELIACETAIKSFLDIVETLGGENEKKRTEKFVPLVKVLPDITDEQQKLLPNLSKLQINGKIRPRTFQVFAFGLYHKAITVTANEGALRAARMQGIQIPAIFHEARALTEQKELTAKHVKH